MFIGARITLELWKRTCDILYCSLERQRGKSYGDILLLRIHTYIIWRSYCNVVLISSIALGGVMFIENGKAKVHVVKPNLAKQPLKSEKEFDTVLVNFIEVSPPSVGLGCIVSHDPVIFKKMIIIYIIIFWTLGIKNTLLQGRIQNFFTGRKAIIAEFTMTI